MNSNVNSMSIRGKFDVNSMGIRGKFDENYMCAYHTVCDTHISFQIRQKQRVRQNLSFILSNGCVSEFDVW